MMDKKNYAYFVLFVTSFYLLSCRPGLMPEPTPTPIEQVVPTMVIITPTPSLAPTIQLVSESANQLVPEPSIQQATEPSIQLVSESSSELVLDVMSVPLSSAETAEEMQSDYNTQGYFTVCTGENTPNFSDRDSEGKLQGFDIELIKELGHRWLDGNSEILELKLNDYLKNDGSVDVERLFTAKNAIAANLGGRKGIILLIVEPRQREECIRKGFADLLISAFTGTYKRCAHKDIRCITPPYFHDTLALLVKNDSFIEGICDLSDKTLLGLTGTTAKEYERQSGRWCPTGSALTVNDRFTDRDQLIEAVKRDRNVAYMTDKAILEGIVESSNGALKIVNGSFPTDALNIAVSRASPLGLDLLIRRTLKAMYEDRTFNHIHRSIFQCTRDPYFAVNSIIDAPMKLRDTDWIAEETLCNTEFEEPYTIQSGDTLIGIALKICGNSNFYPAIQSLNPDILQGETIYPGVKIKVRSACTGE